MAMDTPHPAVRPTLNHSRFEDVQAVLAGTLFVAMAMVVFGQAGLLTGGTAGAAFLLHYATGIGFGPLFFVVNLPSTGSPGARWGASSRSRPSPPLHSCLS